VAVRVADFARQRSGLASADVRRIAGDEIEELRRGFLRRPPARSRLREPRAVHRLRPHALRSTVGLDESECDGRRLAERRSVRQLRGIGEDIRRDECAPGSSFASAMAMQPEPTNFGV